MLKPRFGKCYINGEFVKAAQTRDVTNPYTGKKIGLAPIADDALLEKAIIAASDAFRPFADLSRFDRSEILHRIYELLGKHHEDFARIISAEGGKPIKFARGEVDRARVTCRWAAEEAVRFGGEWLPLDIHPGAKRFTSLVGRVPLGPTLAISPFNFPLNLVMHKVAPALAVGCTVVLKPSSDTPFTSLMLAEIFDKAGCPPGVFNVVPCSGPSFEKLVTDDRPAMLSFTGSPAVGWHLKSIAGRKRVALELGGNAAAVVHEDADLKFAAGRIAFGAFAHAGQVCISVQRVLVHEPVYEKFIKLLVRETKKIEYGDPSDENVMVGPMISDTEADRVEEWIAEAVGHGSKVLVNGKRNGPVLSPVLLGGCRKSDRVWSREVFGPVAVVMPYKKWDGRNGALELVNDSAYGLQAGIFTKDIDRIMLAYKTLEVGAVVVNDVPTVRVDNYPYGGTKESGQGREGVRCTMHEMSEERTLVLRLGL